jgi:hypothetical protein
MPSLPQHLLVKKASCYWQGTRLEAVLDAFHAEGMCFDLEADWSLHKFAGDGFLPPRAIETLACARLGDSVKVGACIDMMIVCRY